MGESRLLTLPPELQTYIYELVLVADDAICINETDPTAATEIPSLALLATCHSIRDIAAPIFFGLNEFYCRMTEETIEDEILQNWLDKFSSPTLKLVSILSIDAIVEYPFHHSRGCEFAHWGNSLDGHVSIDVDFRRGKVTHNLNARCCGKEQKQYACVVQYLEETVEALEEGDLAPYEEASNVQADSSLV